MSISKEDTKGLRKRGKYYFYDYKYNNKRHRFSTGEEDLRNAIIAKYRILEEIDRINSSNSSTIINNNSNDVNNNSDNDSNNYINNNTQTKKVYTFDDIALKFIEEKERNCKEGTVKNYKIFLKNIFPFFTKKSLNSINRVTLKEYENYRQINGCKEQYLREELGILQSIFNLAIEYEMTENNPFNTYKFKKKLKSYEPKERFLKPEEIRLLLKECNEYLRRLIIFLLETGTRIKEALNICYTDISTDIKTNIQYLVLRKEITKSNKTRLIPLSKLAMEQINKQKIDIINSLFIFTNNKGKSYSTTPKKALYNAFKKANVEPAGFHIFRHTFASLKLQGLDINGNKIKPLSMEVVSQILGHKDIKTTQKHYVRFSNESILRLFIGD
jgi:integrase